MPNLDEYMKTCALVLLRRICTIEDWTLRQYLEKGGLRSPSICLLQEHWDTVVLSEERLILARSHFGQLLLHIAEANRPMHYLFACIALTLVGDEEEARIAIEEKQRLGPMVPAQLRASLVILRLTHV